MSGRAIDWSSVFAAALASGDAETMRAACRANDSNGDFDDCDAEVLREILQGWLDDDRRHTRDEDCALDPDGVCTTCGVYHGDPCPDCGGRGYHAEGCALFDEESAPSDPERLAAWSRP